MEQRQRNISYRSCVRFAAGTVIVPAFFSLGAAAADFEVGEGTLSIRGMATLGTALRASGRDPGLMPTANGALIGLQSNAAGGVNSDDGNLNYDRGSRVSTVLKALVDMELKQGATRGFVRARAWTDYTQEHQGVPWGNLRNGYVAGQPLSDSGFNNLARFSGVTLMDAFVEHSFGAEGKSLIRLGNQSIPWGVPTSIRGGLDQVNAQDLVSRGRPGSSLDEMWNSDQRNPTEANAQSRLPASSTFPGAVFDIPTLAAFSNIAISREIAAQAFYQFKFQPSQLPGCGTFGAYADYVTDGCDKVLVGANDRLSLASGAFGRRAADLMPGNGGQYGLGVTYTNMEIGRLGAYFANIHSRRFSVGAVKSTRLAPPVPLIPGDPGGTNVQYFVEYPEDVRIYALNYMAPLKHNSLVFVELSHQPNQVLRLNATDLLNAFASNAAPTVLRSDATALAPGGYYHGFDRFKVTQFNVGGRMGFDTLDFAKRLQLEGDLAVKYVHDLPDPAVRRYGRGDIFGVGPVNGACAGGSLQCSNDGYVSPMSLGYRLRATFLLPNVVPGLTLLPSLLFAHDVKGWSYDDTLNEKRKAATFALRGIYGKSWFGEVAYTSYWGGLYNVSKDRDVIMASAGLSF